MTISITPQLEDFIKEQVAAGRYASSSEVVRAGLRLLQDLELEKTERQAALKRWVQAGIDDPETLDAASVHERMRTAIGRVASSPSIEIPVVGAEKAPRMSAEYKRRAAEHPPRLPGRSAALR